MKYRVQHRFDDGGGEFCGGPSITLETDDLSDAMAEVNRLIADDASACIVRDDGCKYFPQLGWMTPEEMTY